MSVPFTFPVSPEDFAAYQEKLLGEPIPDHMRKAMYAWIPVFNESFSEGLENDQEALEKSLSMMDHLIERHSASPILSKLLRAAKRWIVYAWKQGNQQRPTPPA